MAKGKRSTAALLKQHAKLMQRSKKRDKDTSDTSVTEEDSDKIKSSKPASRYESLLRKLYPWDDDNRWQLRPYRPQLTRFDPCDPDPMGRYQSGLAGTRVAVQTFPDGVCVATGQCIHEVADEDEDEEAILTSTLWDAHLVEDILVRNRNVVQLVCSLANKWNMSVVRTLRSEITLALLDEYPGLTLQSPEYRAIESVMDIIIEWCIADYIWCFERWQTIAEEFIQPLQRLELTEEEENYALTGNAEGENPKGKDRVNSRGSTGSSGRNDSDILNDTAVNDGDTNRYQLKTLSLRNKRRAIKINKQNAKARQLVKKLERKQRKYRRPEE